MNNEPVAWMLLRDESCVELTEWFGVMRGWEEFLGDNEKIVELYSYPSEHDLGIAEAIGFEKGHKSAEDMLRQQQAEIEEWKRKYKDMHNLATQAMSRVHELQKAQQ